MYPKNSICDQVQCLETLLGMRSQCTQPEEECAPFFLEDIEGIDVQALAKIAKGSNLTGVDFGNQIINSAAREMLGDLELLVNNGYSMQNIAGELCSACNLLPVYTAGGGITIRTNVPSPYQILHITKLSIMANMTGPYEVVIDDGLEPQVFPVNLIAGTIMPVLLNYSTAERMVRIYLSDNTVGMGNVNCATQSSCGCGASAKSGLPVIITGWNGLTETTAQYGFLPCATVTCSYDALICNMIKFAPNIFGLTLLYKAGEKLYAHRGASERNNAQVSFNDEEKAEDGKNYGKLYWWRMQGTNKGKGIKQIVSEFLSKQKKDKCVSCDAVIKTGYVTG
jgi:hypothetical protein